MFLLPTVVNFFNYMCVCVCVNAVQVQCIYNKGIKSTHSCEERITVQQCPYCIVVYQSHEK